MKKQWYAAVVATGQEQRIADAIEATAKQNKIKTRIGRVLVPTETIKKQTTAAQWRVLKQQKFQGYLFIELAPSPQTRNILHDVKGFYSLLPNSDAPVPLSEHETLVLLAEQKQDTTAAKSGKARVVIPYDIGHAVKITNGAFNGTTGIVKDIDEPTPGAEPVVEVEITILGQETKVRLAYWQLTQI